MVSYVLNVDKVGDLKFGRKKCRLHKKADVVKVAKDYGISTPNKKTVSELCGSLKKKIQKAEQISRGEAKKILANQNNIPLAKLYPEAAKKRAATKKKALTPSMKAALKKKAVTNFMKGMVTTNSNIKKLRELNVNNTPPKPKPKPRSPSPAAVARARANVKNAINKRVSYMNADGKRKINRASPRKIMKIARELRRLR